MTHILKPFTDGRITSSEKALEDLAAFVSQKEKEEVQAEKERKMREEKNVESDISNKKNAEQNTPQKMYDSFNSLLSVQKHDNIYYIENFNLYHGGLYSVELLDVCFPHEEIISHAQLSSLQQGYSRQKLHTFASAPFYVALLSELVAKRLTNNLNDLSQKRERDLIDEIFSLFSSTCENYSLVTGTTFCQDRVSDIFYCRKVNNIESICGNLVSAGRGFIAGTSTGIFETLFEDSAYRQKLSYAIKTDMRPYVITFPQMSKSDESLYTLCFQKKGETAGIDVSRKTTDPYGDYAEIRVKIKGIIEGI